MKRVTVVQSAEKKYRRGTQDSLAPKLRSVEQPKLDGPAPKRGPGGTAEIARQFTGGRASEETGRVPQGRLSQNQEVGSIASHTENRIAWAATN